MTKKKPTTPKPSAEPRADGMQPRYGQLADLLRATKGISVPEIQEALGGNVQPHTVRGMLSILRKKYGLAIETELQRGGSLYRITPK